MKQTNIAHFFTLILILNTSVATAARETGDIGRAEDNRARREEMARRREDEEARQLALAQELAAQRAREAAMAERQSIARSIQELADKDCSQRPPFSELELEFCREFANP